MSSSFGTGTSYNLYILALALPMSVAIENNDIATSSMSSPPKVFNISVAILRIDSLKLCKSSTFRFGFMINPLEHKSHFEGLSAVRWLSPQHSATKWLLMSIIGTAECAGIQVTNLTAFYLSSIQKNSEKASSNLIQSCFIAALATISIGKTADHMRDCKWIVSPLTPDDMITFVPTR